MLSSPNFVLSHRMIPNRYLGIETCDLPRNSESSLNQLSMVQNEMVRQTAAPQKLYRAESSTFVPPFLNKSRIERNGNVGSPNEQGLPIVRTNFRKQTHEILSRDHSSVHYSHFEKRGIMNHRNEKKFGQTRPNFPSNFNKRDGKCFKKSALSLKLFNSEVSTDSDDSYSHKYMKVSKDVSKECKTQTQLKVNDVDSPTYIKHHDSYRMSRLHISVSDETTKVQKSFKSRINAMMYSTKKINDHEATIVASLPSFLY